MWESVHVNIFHFVRDSWEWFDARINRYDGAQFCRQTAFEDRAQVH